MQLSRLHTTPFKSTKEWRATKPISAKYKHFSRNLLLPRRNSKHTPIEVRHISMFSYSLECPFDVVQSLSNELRTLKENVCQSCKKIFTATMSLASPQAILASRSYPGTPEDSMNFWRLVWQHHALPVLAGYPGWASSYLDIDSISLDQFPSLNPPLKPTLIPISPSITERSLTLSISPTESSSNGISPSVSQDEIDNGTLHVNFVRSFIRKGQIRSVRFSADGRYLGVVLRKGSRHITGAIVIFDIETGEETWSVVIFCDLLSLNYKRQRTGGIFTIFLKKRF